MIVHKECFGTSFSLIIAGTYPDGIYIAPVGFGLGMYSWVPIHLTGGCLEDASAAATREAKHIDRTVDTDLRRLHRIKLVMNGAGRAGEIENLVDFNIERMGHVVTHHLEISVVEKMSNIAACSGVVVVNAEHFAVGSKQPFTKKAAEKTGRSGHEDAFGSQIQSVCHYHFNPTSLISRVGGNHPPRQIARMTTYPDVISFAKGTPKTQGRCISLPLNFA
jgi:hypothetical protein